MDYMVSKDGALVSNAELIEFYIPYSKKNFVERYGDGYMILGIAKVRIYTTEANVKNNKFIKKKFSYPNIFISKPADVVTVMAPFPKDEPTEKYFCLKYPRGSVIVNQDVVIEDLSSVETLFMGIIEGRMAYAGYLNLPDILYQSKVINDVSLRIPAYMEEVIMATAYRDKHDVNVFARHSPTGEIVGLTSRVNTSSKAYPGFTSEDPYYMLMASSTTEEEGDTDLEKIIKGEYD